MDDGRIEGRDKMAENEKDIEDIDSTSYAQGAADVEEVYADSSDLEDDADEAYDPSIEGDEPAEGLFSSPARVITLVASSLLLFALTGAIAWMLGAQDAEGASGKAVAAVPLDDSLTPGVVINYPPNQSAPKVGAPAPDFTLINADTGEPLTLSSLKGKPVWINFWATWCHACVVEMPDMQKVYNEYKERGLVILGVDNDEPREDVNSFTKTYGYDWTFLLDPGGNIAYQYHIEAIPTHWFVGRDGVMKVVQIGALPENYIVQSIEKIID